MATPTVAAITFAATTSSHNPYPILQSSYPYSDKLGPRYTAARKLRHKELNFGARTSLGCRNFLFSTDPATSTVLEQVCWSDAYKRHTWMSASRKLIVRDVLGEHGRGHTWDDVTKSADTFDFGAEPIRSDALPWHQ